VFLDRGRDLRHVVGLVSIVDDQKHHERRPGRGMVWPISGWRCSGGARVLAQALALQPMSVYRAARRGRVHRAEWERLVGLDE
jgi:hypothetical protein